MFNQAVLINVQWLVFHFLFLCVYPGCVFFLCMKKWKWPTGNLLAPPMFSPLDLNNDFRNPTTTTDEHPNNVNDRELCR